MSKYQVEIKPYHTGKHSLCIVTTVKGYCFYCLWANPVPSEAQVREAWRTDRKSFLPYNG